MRHPERYRILGEHGRGGLGRVSRAHDEDLGRDVAIKELISRDHVSEIRFLREALITARLEHPGIVPVHEAGRWPDGTPFYAMKLVAGRPLRELIAERRTVDERIGLLHHVIAVADAIAYAHGRSIIHRDLKPSNVIVGDFGETVVIDWGLAKDLTAPDDVGASGSASGSALRVARDDGLTSAGSVLGTPAYMAPEQERGEPVDQRADVHAIGAMLWELCALERRPPAGHGQRHRALRRAGIDRDLAAIIHKAVDPDPARRYRDAGALAADLKAFKSGARIAARSYSPWAMLVRWTRRHRALALSAGVIAVLAVAGSIAYVRRIAAERDRADRALTTAQQERDRAKLSEAAVLVEKDPARARDLLAALAVRSPQYALLTSRARQRASMWTVPVLAGIWRMSRAPDSSSIAVVTRDGELYRLDPRSATLQLQDRDLQGTVTARAGGWLHARQPFGRGVTIGPSSSPLDPGALTGIAALVGLDDAVYALDAANDLYRLSSAPPVLVRRGIHRVAGGGRVLVTCALDGTLEVLRDGATVLRRRCARTASPETIAVVGDDYAALTEAGTLVVSRGGQLAELPTAVSGEHELALSSTGVVAIADYERGGAWLVRPGARTVEAGPVHASGLSSTAAAGSIAAWGYVDGTVIALDTTSGARWRLHGLPDQVNHVSLDEPRGTLIGASVQQIRAWKLAPGPVARIGPLSCNLYNLTPSPDDTEAAFDCHEGGVWLWSRASGRVTQLHQHAGHAYGVQWLGDRVCSSGWDGRILCSTRDGRLDRALQPGGGRIAWLEGSPGHQFVAFASLDGRIWKLDRDLHELYSQGATPYRVAIDPRGTLLASCGLDGSLIVFDLAAGRIAARALAHTGAIRSLGWLGDELWSAGVDGALRRWRLEAGRLVLRGELREPAPILSTRVFAGGAVSALEGGVLSIARGGASPLRLELGTRIYAIDVSPDTRYIVASVLGEVVVIDQRDHKLATLSVESSSMAFAGFVSSTSLAVSASDALEIVRVDELDYVGF